MQIENQYFLYRTKLNIFALTFTEHFITNLYIT
jgi:hypothetical protein